MQRDYEEAKAQKEELEKQIEDVKQQKQAALDQSASTIFKLNDTIETMTGELGRYQKENSRIVQELEEFKQLIKSKE